MDQHERSAHPDQQLALRSAAQNLRAEFEGIFGAETIELFLTTSYDQFADRATVRPSSRSWPSASPANG